MFSHLDDANPFRPDVGFRAATVRRGRRLRRRRRIVAGASAVGCSLAVVAGALSLSLDRQLDEVDRIEVAGVVDSHDAGLNDPTVFLVAGIDGPRTDNGIEIAGAMADVILLLRADPSTGRLSVLSIPRDLMVEGSSYTGRANGAFQEGGADGLVAAVEEATGVGIDHYVEIGFEGFVELADAADHLAVRIEAPLRDVGSGLALRPAECHRLTGTEALALARSRHLEVEQDGRWVSDSTSDLGRITRQQMMVQAALASLVDLELSSEDVSSLTGLLAEHATVDAGLSDAELFKWGRWLISRGEDNLTPYPVPVEDVRTAEWSMVLVPAEGWDQTMSDFDNGAAPSIDTASDADRHVVASPDGAGPVIGLCR